MFQESRFFLAYEIDGIKKETTELLSKNQADIEKRILEEEGATNVKIVKYRSRLI